jgi:hypothetical protein
MSTTPTEPTPNNATVTTSTGGTVPVTTTVPATPPPADPPKTDPPADKGYPANTSISDMTDGQKAAYFEERSRIEENRRKELLTLTGGKYGDALKADLARVTSPGSTRPTASQRRTEVLDISAFTAGTHYPNGYIPSGTPVAQGRRHRRSPTPPLRAPPPALGVLAGHLLTDQRVVGTGDFAAPLLTTAASRPRRCPGHRRVHRPRRRCEARQRHHRLRLRRGLSHGSLD